MTVKIVDEDFPKIKEVDSKLVALARMLDAKVITNDFNLNKIAELQGVSVLNIHELANALKPVVLPGETIKLFVIKEGKEHNQGVAYLDDYTMVVIENGKRLIGKNVDVTVTSVLQTTAGQDDIHTKRGLRERELRAGMQGRAGSSGCHSSLSPMRWGSVRIIPKKDAGQAGMTDEGMIDKGKKLQPLFRQNWAR